LAFLLSFSGVGFGFCLGLSSFSDFISVFLGIVVVFMIDHTSAKTPSPWSPGRSVQVQELGNAFVSLFCRPEGVRLAAGVGPLDLAWFPRRNSGTVAGSRHNQISSLACSEQPVKRQCPYAQQGLLRRATVPINNSGSNSHSSQQPLLPTHSVFLFPVTLKPSPRPLWYSSSPSLEWFTRVRLAVTHPLFEHRI
jgi:hypothetical protein